MSFDAGSAKARIFLDDTQYKKGAKNVAATNQKLMKSFGLMQIGIVAVGVALTVAFTKSIKKANEFTKAFSNVRTLLDESVTDSKRMQKELLNLDARLGSSIELTKGLYQALSASVEPAKAVKFVGEAAKFAKAGLVGTFEAVDVLTTVLNAYGMEAEKVTQVSDVLFQTIKKGKITGAELAASLGKVIPIAATLGINVEELGAAVATMTKQGINSFNTMTQLRSLFIAFIKPSEAMQKAIEDFGFSSGSALIEAKGLTGVLELLEIATKGNKEELSKLLPNQRAVMAAMALSGKQAENFTDALETMNNAVGSTQEAFEKQELTFDTFKNQMEKLGIVLGNIFLPMIFKMTIGLTTLALKFTELLTAEIEIEKKSNKLKTVTNTLVKIYDEYAAVTNTLKNEKDRLTATEEAELRARQALLRLDVTKQTLELANAYKKLFDEQGKLLPKFQKQQEFYDQLEERALEYSKAILDAEASNRKFAEVLVNNAGVMENHAFSIETIGKMLKNNLTEIAKFEGGLATMEKQVSSSITAIATAVNGGALAFEKLAFLPESLRKKIQTEMAIIKNTIIDVNDAIVDDTEDTTQKIKDKWDKIGDKIRNGFTETGNKIIAIMQGVLQAISLTVNSIFGMVESTLQNQLEVLKDTNAQELEDLKNTKDERLLQTEEEFEVKKEQLDEDRANNLITQEEYDTQLTDLEKIKADNTTAIEKEMGDKITAQKDENTKKENKKQQEIFNAQKANQIASVWIQAATGIVGAWASAAQWPGPSIVAGMALAGVMTGLITALAIANTAVIASQTFVSARKKGGMSGGLTRVNEAGGEIITLPDNSQVIPADISRQIAAGIGGASGHTINVSFAGAQISDTMSLRKISNWVSRDIAKQVGLVQ